MEKKVIPIKPVVTFTDIHRKPRVGQSAIVKPVDHPSNLVSNERLVITSHVTRVNKHTGEFETENTLYVPATKLNFVTDCV